MNSEFEGKLLVFRLLLPFILGSLAGWLLGGSALMPVVRGREQGSRGGFFWSWLLGFSLVSLAFIASDFGSRGILLDPRQWSGWEAKEPWMHWVWVGPSVFGLWGLVDRLASWTLSLGVGRVILFGVPLAILVIGMFPGGDGYADLQSTFRAFGGLTIAFSILNWLFVSQRQLRAQSPWLAWAFVVQLGCIAVVVLQSYASLGEWLIFCLAMLSGVLLLSSLESFLRGRRESVGTKANQVGDTDGSLGGRSQVSVDGVRELSLSGSAWLLLFGFAACAGLCVSRAYAWTPLPWWMLILLLGLPTIFSSIDWLLCKFAGGGLVRYRGLVRILGLAFATLIMIWLVYTQAVEAQPQW